VGYATDINAKSVVRDTLATDPPRLAVKIEESIRNIQDPFVQPHVGREYLYSSVGGFMNSRGCTDGVVRLAKIRFVRLLDTFSEPTVALLLH